MRKYLLVAAMGLAACGSNKTPSGKTATGSTTTDGSASNPNGDTTATTADPNDASSYTGPTIAMMGRFAALTDGTHEMGWAGSRISVRVAGTTTVSIGLKSSNVYNSTPQWFDVSIDGGAPTKFMIDNTYQTPTVFTFPVTLPDTNTHTISWTKVTEGSYGAVIFTGVTPGTGGTLLPTMAPAVHRIEFIGDSITNGYGSEGNAPLATPCAANANNENSDLAFAALTASALSADYALIAYSGKGLATNLDGTTTNTVSDIFLDTLPPSSNANDTTAAITWDPSGSPADVVVINLGTNDFSYASSGMTTCTTSTCNPVTADYVAAYEALLKNVRAAYPNAYIFAATGPMLTDTSPANAQQYTTAKAYISSAIAGFGDAKVFAYDFGVQDTSQNLGCDYHPSASTHSAMATKLAATIKSTTNWQ